MLLGWQRLPFDHAHPHRREFRITPEIERSKSKYQNEGYDRSQQDRSPSVGHPGHQIIISKDKGASYPAYTEVVGVVWTLTGGL